MRYTKNGLATFHIYYHGCTPLYISSAVHIFDVSAIYSQPLPLKWPMLKHTNRVECTQNNSVEILIHKIIFDFNQDFTIPSQLRFRVSLQMLRMLRMPRMPWMPWMHCNVRQHTITNIIFHKIIDCKSID